MRSDGEIVTARHMVGAHEATQPVTPMQKAALYGMRVALGMLRFELPKGREECVGFLRGACRAFDPMLSSYANYRHDRKPNRSKKLPLDWVLFKEMARVTEGQELPPYHRTILLGIRVACSWVLKLPAGGRALEELMKGMVTEVGVPRHVSAENYNMGG